jgi:tetratricopeptide (TPR) repeat protein
MNRLAGIAFAVVLAYGAARPLRAQQINPTIPPPPPPPEEPSTAATAKSANTQPIDPTVPPPPPSDETPDTPAAPAAPAFDPLHAQRSIDVGTFYLKKGVYDAAIDRFIEAANYQPSLAMPWKLLGEAYEKKHEYGKAVESYQKYLKLFPHAEDAAKIKKRISELEDKAPQEPSKEP